MKPKVTEIEMQESFSIGPLMICTACENRDYTPMEADAYKYECPVCGAKAWSSAEELLVRGECEIVDEFVD